MSGFDYDDKIVELWINNTTRYTMYHKRYIISKLKNIPLHTFKCLDEKFLIETLLLKTIRERRQFRKSVKFLDFCNGYYTIYLCKQILGEYEDNYGFEAYKRFFFSSKKVFRHRHNNEYKNNNPFGVLFNR